MEERIAELVKKYNIKIHVDGEHIAVNPNIAKNKEDVTCVKANKEAIIAYIKAEKEKEEQARIERRNKINDIEGLEEIRNAKQDLANWHYEFNKSFEDVGGLGVRPKPNYNFDAMYEKYPRAVAYLKAEDYKNASNYRKSAIGKNALEKIINGEDYNAVIENMEKEWKEYCEEHIWD